jgi:hypothetical protein
MCQWPCCMEKVGQLNGSVSNSLILLCYKGVYRRVLFHKGCEEYLPRANMHSDVLCVDRWLWHPFYRESIWKLCSGWLWFSAFICETEFHVCGDQADWCSGNTLELYLRGAHFESWLGHWYPDLRSLWFFSVPPGMCQDSTLIRPWPFPYKSFQIHPSIILPFRYFRCHKLQKECVWCAWNN